MKKNIGEKERREGEKGEGEDLQPGMGSFLVWDLFVNFHLDLVIVLDLLHIKLSYCTWDSCSV